MKRCKNFRTIMVPLHRGRFLVCLSRFWNDEVSDNGNDMKQCNFQNNMVPLHRGRFVVVHIYSTFSIDPHNFLLGENIYQKLLFFGILGAVSPLSSHKGEIWHESADLGLPPLSQIL